MLRYSRFNLKNQEMLRAHLKDLIYMQPSQLLTKICQCTGSKGD